MKLAVSFGDCNGIGFECFLKAIDILSESYFFEDYSMELFANPNTAKNYIEKGGLTKYQVSGNKVIINDVAINIVPLEKEPEINFGENKIDSGEHALESLTKAIKAVINKEYDGLVTIPVSKTALNMAGWHYPGQTEMIAEKLNSSDYQMVLFNESLRVALATIHIPIKEVTKILNKDIIIKQAEMLNLTLKQDFGIKYPKIAVLSLNPHAGENGSIGDEEIEYIIPAVEEIISKGIKAEGPYPSDGFFGFGDYKKYDGILAMYHDQGLTPLKLLAGGNGVNYTANLDIKRTSPDHGTSYSKAGKGIADPKSTISAIEWCVRIIENSKKFESFKEE
jgi:4-hydroxythreonine-4-phosphate dehydrogenase